MLQLLSDQESRRLGRRWCRRHLRRGTCRPGETAARPRRATRPASQPPHTGHDGSPGRRSGRGAAGQAPPPRGMERGSPRSRRAPRRPARPSPAGASLAAAGGRPRLSPLRGAHRPPRRVARATPGGRGLDAQSTTPRRFTSPRPTRMSASAGELSQSRRRLPAPSSPFRSGPGCRTRHSSSSPNRSRERSRPSRARRTPRRGRRPSGGRRRRCHA